MLVTLRIERLIFLAEEEEIGLKSVSNFPLPPDSWSRAKSVDGWTIFNGSSLVVVIWELLKLPSIIWAQKRQTTLKNISFMSSLGFTHEAMASQKKMKSCVMMIFLYSPCVPD